MHLAGWPLSTLLPLAAGAAALAVVLYILKLRRRPVAVVFSPIWREVLGDRESTRLFSQLKRILSLLLQLLLLALLIFSLGDPRRSAEARETRSVVVLVDGSASMKASDVAPDRLSAARAEVAKLIDGLGDADRMLIALMDANLTPLSTMTSERSELRQSLDRLRASDTRADLGRALGFAQDSLRDAPNPEIVLVSDGAFGAEALRSAPALGALRLSYVPIGTASDNLALTSFSVRRYPLDASRYEVMLEVQNTNDAPADVELTLLGDDQVVETSRQTVEAGQKSLRFYSDRAGASRTLEARIRPEAGRDHLEADNRAYALVPERRRARVLLVTSGNSYLEAALLLDEYLEVTQVAPDAPLPDGKFDVTIADGVRVPLERRLGGVLYLNPPDVKQGGPLAHSKAIEQFGFDSWDRKSPILGWIAPENIQVMKGHALKPEPGDKVIGSSEQGAILVAGSRAGQSFVALGFDPRDSDMVLRVAWPLFVLNTINAVIEEDTRYISSYRTGEVWNVAVPADSEAAWVTPPGGARQRVAAKDGWIAYPGLAAGFHQVVPLAPGGAEAAPFAVAGNLSDPEESRIAPVPTLALGQLSAAAPQGFDPRANQPLWVYLLLAALGLSAIEWVTYHRRVTV
ncbi:MAG: VWA domain-containing protein [Polyangiaceae bacterium]